MHSRRDATRPSIHPPGVAQSTSPRLAAPDTGTATHHHWRDSVIAHYKNLVARPAREGLASSASFGWGLAPWYSACLLSARRGRPTGIRTTIDVP